MAMTTFLGTLQHVPQLLQALVSSTTGLKVLRLVCKQTRAIPLLAVRNCCIKLCPDLAETGPLLELASLLKDSRLQHLRVDIHVQSGTCMVKYRMSLRREPQATTATGCVTPRLTSIQFVVVVRCKGRMFQKVRNASTPFVRGVPDQRCRCPVFQVVFT